MAERDTEQQERTEKPTPKRLEDARRRGQVPRSRELNMTFVMLAGAAVLLAARPFFAERLGELARAGLELSRTAAMGRDGELLLEALLGGIGSGIVLLAPLWAAVLVATFAGPAVFGGWAFSTEALAPKLERLDPVAGLKRVLGWTGLAELAKALLKFLLIATVAIAILWQLSAELLGLGGLESGAGMRRAADLLSLAFLGCAAALVLIAAADVPFQAWQHQRKLRMTKQELKEEQKETEGRPEVRSRIRSLQQQVAARRMMADVPKADVVVVNPTHYAVALRYDAAKMKAPVVIARGTDLIALAIRRVAEAHGVPVFEHPAVARALYHDAKLGAPISPRLYVAVAQVLSYVYQLKRGSRAPAPRIDIDPELEAPAWRRRFVQTGVGASRPGEGGAR